MPRMRRLTQVPHSDARSPRPEEDPLPNPQLEPVQRGPGPARLVDPQGPRQQGAQFEYSGLAIECLLTLRTVYHLPLRATEGFARSIFELMGLELPVPDYSTLSRRARALRITLPKKAAGPLHLVLDSTGLKVYGEGEWKVRKHGYSKRRTWLKLHLAIDPETHEIQAALVSEPGVTDAEAVPDLLRQVANPLEAAEADGAYDQQGVYDALLTGAQRRSSFRSGRIRGWKPRTSSLMIGVSGGGCGRWT
jgi:Transposase DDE domain